MKIKLILLLTALLLLATANATTVAVLEITVSSDEAEMTVDETKFLTDELRRQAMRVLPKDYSVLNREKIISLVPKTAENLNSVIDIGMVIKSDYVTQGLIGKVGGLFTLTVELYETASGNLVGDFVKESPDYKGLLDAIRENSPSLFSKIMPTGTTLNDPQQPTPIPTNIPAEPKSGKTSLWVAIGLDVLGATALGLGIYKNINVGYYRDECEKREKGVWQNDDAQYEKNKKDYDDNYKKMKDATTARNIFYIAGGALLLGGVAVHIWF